MTGWPYLPKGRPPPALPPSPLTRGSSQRSPTGTGNQQSIDLYPPPLRVLPGTLSLHGFAQLGAHAHLKSEKAWNFGICAFCLFSWAGFHGGASGMTSSLSPVCPHCSKRIAPPCPHCGSDQVFFNGHNQCRCKGCRKFFTPGTRGRISPAIWSAADVLLSAQVEVKVISEALGISRRHLYTRRAGELAG